MKNIPEAKDTLESVKKGQETMKASYEKQSESAPVGTLQKTSMDAKIAQTDQNILATSKGVTETETLQQKVAPTPPAPVASNPTQEAPASPRRPGISG